jgi:hypothetical protein
MNHCAWCGQKFDRDMVSCPVCGKSNNAYDSMNKNRIDNEGEQVYYLDEQGVRIDSGSFTFPTRNDRKGFFIYNISDIKSVKIRLVNSSFPTSVIMISGGIILSIAGLPNSVLYLLLPGIFIAISGSIWALAARWNYYLVISSTSGSNEVLFTTNSQYISRILEAVNKALSSRTENKPGLSKNN